MRLAKLRSGGQLYSVIWNRAKKVWVPIRSGAELWELAMAEGAVRSELDALENETDPSCSVSGEFAVPVKPTKILCVGLNYADHAKEFGDPIPPEPVFFCKALSTLIPHGAGIVVPRESDKIDYEAELVAVIGKWARRVSAADALDYVAGYTCGNDVSCRDWQKNKPAGQWFLGKSFDTFAPLGPWLVSRDEAGNPNELAICSRLNGQVMQSSTTRNFIFPIEELIAYASNVMTLEPGDLVFTGTPGGIGDRRNPPVYLKRGDTIEVEIEKIGTLSNPVDSEVK